MSLKQLNEKNNTSQQQQQQDFIRSNTMSTFKPQHQMPLKTSNTLKRSDHYGEQLAMRQTQTPTPTQTQTPKIPPRTNPRFSMPRKAFPESTSSINTAFIDLLYTPHNSQDSADSKNNYLEENVSFDKNDEQLDDNIKRFYLKIIIWANKKTRFSSVKIFVNIFCQKFFKVLLFLTG